MWAIIFTDITKLKEHLRSQTVVYTKQLEMSQKWLEIDMITIDH